MNTGYYSASEAQDGLAVVAKYMTDDASVQVRYHKGTRICADTVKKIIHIPAASCASGLSEDILNQLRCRVYHETWHIASTIGVLSKGALGSIENALEDMRIEAEGMSRYPGTRAIMQGEHTKGNMLMAEMQLKGQEFRPLWEALCACMYSCNGLNPAWNLSDKAKSYMDVMYAEFCKWRDCKNTAEVRELAKKLLAMLKEAKQQQEQDQQDDQQDQGDDDEQDDQQGNKQQSKSGSKQEQNENENEAEGAAPDELDDDASNNDSDDSESGEESQDGEKQQGKQKSKKQDSKKQDKAKSDKKQDKAEKSESGESDESDDKDGNESGEGDEQDGEEGQDGNQSESAQGDDQNGDESQDGESGSESGSESESGEGQDGADESGSEDGEQSGKDSSASESSNGKTGKSSQNMTPNKAGKGKENRQDDKANGNDGDDADDVKNGKQTKSTKDPNKMQKSKAEISQELDEESQGQDLQEVLSERLSQALDELIANGELGYTSRRDNDQHLIPEIDDRVRSSFKRDHESVSAGVASLTRSMEQALRALTQCRKDPYQYEGSLDFDRLVALTKGIGKDLYYQVQPGMKIDTAISIIIDESGSMGDKVEETRLAALAIGEALNALKIPFEIFGTTTGNNGYNTPALEGFSRTNPIVYRHYKGFGENWMAVRPRISTTGSHSNNIDGEAVEYAANNLKHRPERRKVIFSLSDGQPCGGHGYKSDEEMAKNLVQVCKRERKNGIEIFGLGINTDEPKRFYGEKFFVPLHRGKMGNEFAKELAKIVSGGKVRM